MSYYIVADMSLNINKPYFKHTYTDTTPSVYAHEIS